ncbi:25S rRNA [Spathaspora sp. JA1]|nr:25S rRNA [Spathaspora sp. JA1]
MGRKLKGKNLTQKGLKGALARHQVSDKLSKKLDQNAEIAKENQINKANSIKKIPKKKNQHSQPQQKGLMPFNAEDRVLLIGEGDFTFARSLISQNFIQPQNLIATSYDSLEELQQKYPNVDSTLDELSQSGVKVLHEVDATKLPQCLKLQITSKLKKAGKSPSLFEDKSQLNYIMFNFPHTGKGIKDVDRNIREHQKLMVEYFKNCKQVFEIVNDNTKNDFAGYVGNSNTGIEGKIIVSMFEGEPYNSWGVKIISRNHGYKVERSGKFDWTMFPEYHHRRTNSTKDTTKPAEQRNARMYIFEKFIQKPVQSNNNDSDSD